MKKALNFAADANPDSAYMGIVVPEFSDVIDLFVALGSTFDIIIAKKIDGEVLFFNNCNPYFGYYWFDGSKIPEDYYDNFEAIDIDKYGEECDFLAGYLLDDDDIDQVLVVQERFVKNP